VVRKLVKASGPEMILAETVHSKQKPDITMVRGPAGSATKTAIELLGGIGRFVKPGNRVVIKPNMSFNSPVAWGTNTHPEVVRELVIMCKEAGASEILVLDHTIHNAAYCLKNSGIQEACNCIGKSVVNVVNDVNQYREVKIPYGICLTASDVMKPVLESDVLIAVPAAKSHSYTKVSLSLKGMMGLVYNRREMHILGLDSSIVDICTILKADLTIIDATRVLSTNGPNGPGKVYYAKTIIASEDMVAADAFTVSNFKWNGKKLHPSKVAHIKEAHERGLGTLEVGNLKVKQLKL
jgi:uncharacterized protein (DUF362 family)